MVVFPPAKINLGLNILRKRPDGYHDLLTCFYPVSWTDILEILPSPQLKFEQSGITVPGNREDNLCLKAYHLLKRDFDLPPVSIYLHKILPMGAGLGGGSSDGAWTLRILNALFNLNLSAVQLNRYALVLGSDCPFFVEDVPMIGEDRGEKLSPVKLSLAGKFLAVIKPDVHVSTRDAFAGIVPKDQQQDLRFILENISVSEWRTEVKNDFEISVFNKYPQIGVIKKQLYEAGALYASMSGSGSSVFGIFDKPFDARSFFPGMTCWSGQL